ncbi:hypothetical protein LTR08_002198 [Meristemomyces frigidus]|nr:hypothetical protein LTR08_002198 [Meristemomyces frigidus]
MADIMPTTGRSAPNQEQADHGRLAAFLSRFGPGRTPFSLGKRKRNSKGKSPEVRRRSLPTPAAVPSSQRPRPSSTGGRTAHGDATAASGVHWRNFSFAMRGRGSEAKEKESHPAPDEAGLGQRTRPSTGEAAGPHGEASANTGGRWRRLSRFVRRDSHPASGGDVAMGPRTPPSTPEPRRSGGEAIRTPEIGEAGPSSWCRGFETASASDSERTASDCEGGSLAEGQGGLSRCIRVSTVDCGLRDGDAVSLEVGTKKRHTLPFLRLRIGMGRPASSSGGASPSPLG